MSYTALYRKFRPTTFHDVKGQEHIVTTLQNQIKAGRIGHAFLFTGTRGTGKTTSAQILARAVNCEHPIEGNPCCEYDLCEEFVSVFWSLYEKRLSECPFFVKYHLLGHIEKNIFLSPHFKNIFIIIHIIFSI